MKGCIEITGVDLVKFAQDVYDLSVPQGMGFMNAVDGGLSRNDAAALVNHAKDFGGGLRMDYIHGRACKMTVNEKNGKLYISELWYNHTDEQLQTLLKRHDINIPDGDHKHGNSCNCADCRVAVGKDPKPSFDEICG